MEEKREKSRMNNEKSRDAKIKKEYLDEEHHKFKLFLVHRWEIIKERKKLYMKYLT